jgi:CheY-like chemotaxis protein
MVLSVLVVDDDERFRALAKRILQGCGYRAESEARNVTDALLEATRHRPDLALVDVGLPDGNGLELSERLVRSPWNMRVVLVSADGDATTQRGAEQAGALGFLAKSDLSCATLDALLRDR